MSHHHHHHHHHSFRQQQHLKMISQLINRHNNNNNNIVQLQYRSFFDLPFQSSPSEDFNDNNNKNNRQEFTDQRIVRFTKTQIYNVVANVDDYEQFLPNCLESTVLSRSPDRMEAELVVGFPPLITEKYTSIIYLDKPNRVLVKGMNSTILKYLESEWKFEELNAKRTLVTFNVTFEFQSTIHSRFMSLFFDDFTKKTMKAFLDRAYIIYSADPLYFDDDGDKS